jgi:cobalamin biosynthesis protein CobT
MARKPRSTAPKQSPVDAERARAWKAVANFNRMVPQLTNFARTLTGDPKIRVRAAKQTGTDGKTIFIRPSSNLADELHHVRELCDERDYSRRSLCGACQQSDDVWRKVYHEISHVVMGSIVRPNTDVLQRFIDMINEWHPEGACSHAEEIVAKACAADDYLVMFNAFHPYMWWLSQGIDDARVDSSMLAINPGMRDSFYSSTYDVFENGIELDDGTRAMWRDRPVNTQIVMGLMLAGSGYEIAPDWLRPEVIEILEDAELRDAISNLRDQDVHYHAHRVIDVAYRLDKMGLLEMPRCKQVDEDDLPSLNEPGGTEGEPSDESTESGASENAGDDGDTDSSEQSDGPESDDGPGEDAGDPTGDGTEGDTASDSAIGAQPEPSDPGGDGTDHQGEPSSDEPDDAQVPGAEDSADGDDDPDGDASTDDADSDGGSGDSEGEAGSQPAPEADDAPEDGSDDDAQPLAGSGDITEEGESGSGGDGDAQDGAVDGDGEPESEPDDEDAGLDSDDGDAGAGADPEGEAAPGAESGEDADGFGAEADDEDGPLGEEVWDEEHDRDPLRAARSIPVEELGTVEEVTGDLAEFHGHEDPHLAPVSEGGEADDEDSDEEKLFARMKEAINSAVMQAAYFDRASQEIDGVKEYEYPSASIQWTKYYGNIKTFLPAEQLIGKVLMKARIVFAENRRSHNLRHLKAGRVDSRALGKRAALGDERLFHKRIVPKKRDYVVGITLDCSGSNHGGHKMERAKRAVFAKAELLNRLGIKFYITAHTGGIESWFSEGYSEPDEFNMAQMWILWVKKVDEPWTDVQRERLAGVRPTAENYDGHTLEFHRKYLESRRESDKALIYYTDGAMPAANYDEELIVLLDEIQLCKKKNIALLAVGISTDSPSKYGFTTVQVDSDNDLGKVVDMLGTLLLN